MKSYKEGHVGKAVCEFCKAVVQARYEYRDVPCSDGAGVVSAILVGVCSNCDTVVAIPPQSSAAIHEMHYR